MKATKQMLDGGRLQRCKGCTYRHIKSGAFYCLKQENNTGERNRPMLCTEVLRCKMFHNYGVATGSVFVKWRKS